MEAILKFNLDDEDDRMAHLRCTKSLDMSLALFEILHNSRKGCENIASNQEGDSDIYDGIYIVYEKIYEILNQYNIKIDDLIR